MRFISWDKTTNLSQQHNQSRLTQDDTLPGHIGPGNNQDLFFLIFEINIVGNKGIAGRKCFFYHRVTSLFDINFLIISNSRLGVIIVIRHLCKTLQAIQLGQRLGHLLNFFSVTCNIDAQLLKKIILQRLALLFGG